MTGWVTVIGRGLDPVAFPPSLRLALTVNPECFNSQRLWPDTGHTRACSPIGDVTGGD